MENLETFVRPLPEKEILIFCTSIENEEEVQRISEIIDSIPGISNWNVDLEDWEKILRIESYGVSPLKIIGKLRGKGIYITEMP